MSQSYGHPTWPAQAAATKPAGPHVADRGVTHVEYLPGGQFEVILTFGFHKLTLDAATARDLGACLTNIFGGEGNHLDHPAKPATAADVPDNVHPLRVDDDITGDPVPAYVVGFAVPAPWRPKVVAS